MQTMTRKHVTLALTFVALLGLVSATARAETVTYSYDANGNLITRTTQSGTSVHDYDPLDRLTSDAIANMPAVLIAYDANGNRTSQQLEGFGETYTYTPSTNRLVQKGAQTLTLDAAGNLINDGQGRTYFYNNAGRLSHIEQGGSTIASYIYNAQGQRTRKTTTTGTTVYHYDLDGQLIAETTGTGQHWRSYIYADDLPIAQIQATASTEAIYYLHSDHLNTPRLATGTTGTVLWRWEGNAFGSLAPNQDPDGDGTVTAIHLRFPGQYYDQETGLHYNWNRYYDPRTGRYITPDPLGQLALFNMSNKLAKHGLAPMGYVNHPFNYTDNNPLRWTDPQGLSKFDKFFGLPKEFWNWCHRQVKRPGDPDLTKEEAKDLFEEWKRLGKPKPDSKGKQGGFVEPDLLPWLIPWPLTPSEFGTAACEEPGGPSCGVMGQW